MTTRVLDTAVLPAGKGLLIADGWYDDLPLIRPNPNRYSGYHKGEVFELMEDNHRNRPRR